MTHGCAVLVSNLGCFRDFILPNETGFVFEGNAPDQRILLSSRFVTPCPIQFDLNESLGPDS